MAADTERVFVVPPADWVILVPQEAPFNTGTPIEPDSSWILSGGEWHDSGFWDDDAFWEDD